MTISDINTSVSIVGDIIDRIAAFKSRNETNKNAALAALIEALNETRSYLEFRNLGGSEDVSRENELSKKWLDAAINVKKIDEESGADLFGKSLYWASSASDRTSLSKTINLKKVLALSEDLF